MTVVQRYKGIEILEQFLIFNKNGEVIDVQKRIVNESVQIQQTLHFG
jgi:hypothetical protein